MKKQWYYFYKDIEREPYVNKTMCLACGADIYTGGMMICVDCWAPTMKHSEKANNNTKKS